MPNVLTRLNLARNTLAMSLGAAAERAGAVLRELVGTFPRKPSPLVQGLLGGALPGSRGEPPPRGTAEYLRAYSTMPWLRAVTDRHSTSVAAVQWKVQALRTKSGKYIQDPVLQRADPELRQKLLAAHQAVGTELVDLVEHPLCDLLYGGNDMMTGGIVRTLTVLYLDLTGEGFFIKQRNKAGVPVALWPMPPHWVRNTPTPTRKTYDLQIGTWGEPVADTEVLWLKKPDPCNPYGRGTGLTQSLADELETDEFAAKMAKQAMFNRGDPSLIISPKNDTASLTEPQTKSLEQGWLQKHRGFWKVALPHFASRALDVKVISRNFEELQLVPLREFERNVIVQVYGMPPEQLGIINDSNRATIEMSDLLFAKNMIVPMCEFLREHYQERLVPEYDQRLFVNYVSPVAEDKERQAEARKAAPHTVKINEWRAAQGLEPDERVGDGYMVPFSVSYTEDLSESRGASPAVARDDTADDDADADGEDPDDEDASAGDDDSDEGGDEKTIRRQVATVRSAAAPAIFRAGQYNAKAISDDDEYFTLVHRVAERLAPKLRRQFLEAVARVRDATDLGDLEVAFASGQLHAVMAAIPWVDLQADLATSATVLHQGLAVAGEAAADELGAALGVTLRFDHTNPAAVAWAQRNAARYVTEVSAATKAAINQFVVGAYAEQRNAQETARLIRDVIGLHSRQVTAVENFRARLLDGGVDGERLERRVQKYAAAQLRRRADTIAEHELLTVSNAGQRQLWAQAVQDGHLVIDRVRRVWIPTHDDRLEAVCEAGPYEPENQTVRIGGSFTSPRDGRKFEGMPEHVKCRCAEGLEIET